MAVSRWDRDLATYAAAEGDMLPHYQTLQRLVRESGAEVVLDLGVRGAVSSWAILGALGQNGECWAVDTSDHRAPDSVTGDPRWHFVKGDTLDTATWEQLPPAAAAFLDTSHEYPDTLEELRLIAEHGVPLIVLHDWKLAEVKRSVYEFIAESGYTEAGEEESPWGMVWLTA